MEFIGRKFSDKSFKPIAFVAQALSILSKRAFAKQEMHYFFNLETSMVVVLILNKIKKTSIALILEATYWT